MRLLLSAASLSTAMLLASCGGAATDADGDGKISQEEVQAKVEAEMASLALKPGKWETTAEVTDVEFDESKLPPESKGQMGKLIEAMLGNKQTTSQCITEEEAKKPRADFFTGNDADGCEYNQFDLAGGKMNMKITCSKPQDGTMIMTANGTFGDESYTMNMDMQGNSAPMGDMRIKSKVTAKRIGDCD